MLTRSEYDSLVDALNAFPQRILSQEEVRSAGVPCDVAWVTFLDKRDVLKVVGRFVLEDEEG